MNENPKSFRTAQSDERTKSAADVVAKHRERVEAKKIVVADAEATCADDPSEKNLARAKAARRELEDVEQDLALAQEHAAKVEREAAAAEHAAIRAEIARRQRDLTEVVDDEALERAVDLELRSLELRQRTEARCAQRRSELEELKQLCARLGASSPEIPALSSMIDQATAELGEIAQSARAQIGGAEMHCWPHWRGQRTFLTGKEGLIVIRTMPDGTQETSGRDATHVVRKAAELLERVEAGRAALEKGAKGASGIAAKAAVAALAALSAITMAGGG